jgi:hypothetical protein
MFPNAADIFSILTEFIHELGFNLIAATSSSQK